MSRLIYFVKQGDTLGNIAKAHGTTVANLQRINGIKDADKITEGQTIALSAKAVCKVDIQMLDAYRNPLKDAKVRLDYRGKSKQFSSGNNGRLPTILTTSPEDKVTIFVHRMDGDWKQIAEVVSGWGNKLVTLVSPKVKIGTMTLPHPVESNGKLKRDEGNGHKSGSKPPENPKTTQGKGFPHGDYGDGKGPKSEHQADHKGFPVTKVTMDQVQLDFLGGYTGERISNQDYANAAKKIGCEVAAIMAVADVETKGKSFTQKNRPTILYERHIFSERTDVKYDIVNPDISCKKRYKPASLSNRKLVKAGKLQEYDIYGCSYERLAKAYSLDRSAALMGQIPNNGIQLLAIWVRFSFTICEIYVHF